jgi:uncharacterized protein (TIGR00725 family)
LARPIQIGVIGGRDVSPEMIKAAESVGQWIAERNAILICGGLGGVMEAACRGAQKAGGTTVGILPMASKEEANPYVDIVIPTDMGIARNAIVVHASDGVIAVDGSYGTLSEIAFALQLCVPLVALKSWEIDPSVLSADNPKEAVDTLFKLIQKKSGNQQL